jgi:hypothetical protein
MSFLLFEFLAFTDYSQIGGLIEFVFSFREVNKAIKWQWERFNWEFPHVYNFAHLLFRLFRLLLCLCVTDRG